MKHIIATLFLLTTACDPPDPQVHEDLRDQLAELVDLDAPSDVELVAALREGLASARAVPLMSGGGAGVGPRKAPEDILVSTEPLSFVDLCDVMLACNVTVPLYPTLTGYQPDGAAETRVAGIGAGMLLHEQQYLCYRELWVNKLQAEAL